MKKILKKNVRRVKFERKAVFSTLGILVVLFGLYGYFLNATVMNIVQRRNMESEMNQVASDVTSLQFRYISKGANLDMAYAESLGYHQVDDAKYVRTTGDEFAFRQ